MFFQNALKNFLLAIIMIMFKVCKRCLQPSMANVRSIWGSSETHEKIFETHEKFLRLMKKFETHENFGTHEKF